MDTYDDIWWFDAHICLTTRRSSFVFTLALLLPLLLSSTSAAKAVVIWSVVVFNSHDWPVNKIVSNGIQ